MTENKENQKSVVAKREEEILRFWQENKIFEKSIETPAGEEPKGEFVFYDGPPFATGTPHFGHCLPTSIKDAIPRFWTMKGFRVDRRWGWDCHGLPVENIVEKELNLKVKKDIEEYGIEKFNEAARGSVMRYTKEWEKIIPRLGRWVDMENDYRTMDSSYTESIWWIFKTLFDKGLIYEGYKSMHICPRCETTLANFEVNQGYKDVTDISVTVKFELLDELETFVLAWTTTPWTLPGNVALAVNPEIDYVKVKKDGIFFIVASERKKDIFGEDFEEVETIKGANLVGKKYKPAFDYFYNDTQIENHNNGWKIYAGEFVTVENGTGVVHIAPAFGDDDLALGQKNNLPFVQHVKMDGTFVPEIEDFAGQIVKPKEDPQAIDIEIIKYLAHKGLLFAKKKITHSYPHCWRCDTPLLNYAASSWFVRVTEFKDKLLESNNKVNWVPEHIKDGRFGKWLEGARDWAISRSRFWGAPIPVWRCDSCEEVKVFGSVEDLVDNLPASKNSYFLMRHGEADHNVQNIVSGKKENPHHLTEKGKQEARSAVETLKDKKIDLIVCSPFVRTKETAQIVASALGISDNQVVSEDGLREIETGLDGRSVEEYHALFENTLEKFTKRPEGGENLIDLKERVTKVIVDLEKKYEGKNILLVSHEYPLWMLETGALGLSNIESAKIKDGHDDYPKTGEIKKLNWRKLPKNSTGEVDLHRPFIDECQFNCSCGGSFKRVTEVFDCWFESGAMPYGQAHYPFEKEKFDPEQGKGFPADFIAEGLDQTRGWFYSLIVLSTALFGEPAYKNVLVNGLILAEDGQKMSKRLKNYPDLNLTIDKYGADALRLYLLGSPAVHADDFSFSERGLGETYRKVILRLLNVNSFLFMYLNEEQPMPSLSDNKLDIWIMSRLGEVINTVEKSLLAYEIDRAIRPIEEFVDDFSTWYLRRSRDRFKSDDKNDQAAAISTTCFIMTETAKVLAPFAPFLAEDLYQKLPISNKKESVHLESWPIPADVNKDLLLKMKKVRQIVEVALSLRSEQGIKVRQPLSVLKIKDGSLLGEEGLFSLIKEEVNVKEVIVDEGLPEEVVIDFSITPELKEEGIVRDLIRHIQESRKKIGLMPIDRVTLTISTDEVTQKIIQNYKEDIKKTVGALELNLGDNSEEEVEIDGIKYKIDIKKN